MESRGGSELPFSIILPTLNEGDNIVPMVETLSRLYPKASIIVVDDNSQDGTPKKARELAVKGIDVTVIDRDPKDRGLTASIFDGILSAKTETYVVMDSDFQHPPERAGDLAERLDEGFDMVVGVREDLDKLSFGRKMASWGANTMASTYLLFKRQPGTSDNMSGFFAGRTELCKSVIRENVAKFERRGFKALFDLLKFLPKDAKVAEVEFRFSERRSGTSKLSSTIVISIMRQCGILGKSLAAITSFFLTNMFGRYLAALILGLIITYGVLDLTDTVWTEELTYTILLAMLISLGYLVVANRLLFTVGRKDGIIRGMKLVFSMLSGFLVSLYVFYYVFDDINEAQMFAMFTGFLIAFAWDSFGLNLKN
jgi:dolichol-phosphate mannosyltransferase